MNLLNTLYESSANNLAALQYTGIVVWKPANSCH